MGNIGAMTEEKIRLTPSAFDKLKDQLTEREGPVRERIVEAIATARAHGDLSENAEYHAAREEQAHNEAKIKELRYKIENAEIVETFDDGVVQLGMLVVLRYEGDDTEETYYVGSREEKGEYDVLTPESPIGKSLLGQSAGDVVTPTVPSGDLKIEIVEVRAP
jgi:transcription elongation factor GreA